MTNFLIRAAALAAVTSVVGVSVLILVWPDPLAIWSGSEWRHILRYMGVGLILLSLLLSLRRWVFKSWGRLPMWLSFHEYCTAAGFILILSHALGYGFHALLPWVLMATMSLCVSTGLLLKWLFLRAKSFPNKTAQSLPPALRVKTWRSWHRWSGILSVALMIIHAGLAYLYGGY